MNLTMPDGSIGSDVAWENAIGGAVSREDPPLVLGVNIDPTLNLLPRRSCTELALRGPMTSSRAALCQWINDTVIGKPWNRTLTITELLSVDGVPHGPSYVYSDAFPVRYVFPRLSVTNTTGNVMEEAMIKPIRCEIH